MTSICPECGGLTAWHDAAASAICTACGTLADPSQTTLADQLIFNDNDQPWLAPAAPPTLKSLRFQRSNWDLAGQGKEARERKNQAAMSQFIKSLAVSLNAPGLTPRADTIFDQAMLVGKFRWGRKAKLVAGASLAIALREYRRPDSLNDIAYLLDEQCPTLVRTLNTVTSVLNITLAPVDPSIHIPLLLTHLTSLFENDTLSTPRAQVPPLPSSLVSQLKSVSLRAASNTATALAALLSRLGPDHSINTLPSPPTAIALFLLGIEAESRAPLPQLGELAQNLGSTCHKTSRAVSMTRYKLIQDVIAVWIEQVPWLGKYEQRTANNGKNRAKVGKRSVVARGTKDVIQFQEEIWKGKLKPNLVLDLDDDCDGEHDNLDDAFGLAVPPRKKQKIANHPLRDATQFLLNPLVAPLPSRETPGRYVNSLQPPSLLDSSVTTESSASAIAIPLDLLSSSALLPVPKRPNDSSSSSPKQPSQNNVSTLPTATSLQLVSSSNATPFLPSYILTAPFLALHSTVPPTRLQLLAASRKNVDDIEDDELFGEGELEGLIRNKEEAEIVGERMIKMGIWTEGDASNNDESRHNEERNRGGSSPDEIRKRKKGTVRGEKEETQPKNRINLDALARLLKDDEDKSGEEEYDAMLLGLHSLDDKDANDSLSLEVHEDVLDEENSQVTVSNNKKDSRELDDGAIVVDEWRPLSPEQRHGHAHAEHYEQEYE